MEQERRLGVEQPQVELLGQELDLLVAPEAPSKIHVCVNLFLEEVVALAVMEALVAKVVSELVLFLVPLEQVVRVAGPLPLVVQAAPIKVQALAVALVF